MNLFTMQICLNICRVCEYSTTSTYLDRGLRSMKDKSVDFMGNLLTSLLRAFNIRALRCEKCGCFLDAKTFVNGTVLASIVDGMGCPEGKWPNDKRTPEEQTKLIEELKRKTLPCDGCGDKKPNVYYRLHA